MIKKEKINDDKMIKIIDDYKPMIYSIIRNFELSYGDYVVSAEDLYQEGCIALFEAASSYKYNSKTKFSTYAYVVIERRIQKVFFKYMKAYQKEYSIDKYEYLDRIDGVKVKAVYDSENNYDNYNINELLKEMNFATELDKKIVKLRTENYSYKEIAKILGVTPKKVDNRIVRLKKMWKKDK